MSFYEQLAAATAAERDYLLSSPVIAGCLRGEVAHASYLAFLGQAFHHVRHTTPLLISKRKSATRSGSLMTLPPPAATRRPCARAAPTCRPR